MQRKLNDLYYRLIIYVILLVILIIIVLLIKKRHQLSKLTNLMRYNILQNHYLINNIKKKNLLP
jgi:hypothetical protein